MRHELVSDYQAAGFAGRLGFGQRAVVIIVDMVIAYFDRQSPLYASVEQTIDSNCRIANAARRADVPVIVTRQEYNADVLPVYRRKVPALELLKPGSQFAAVVPELASLATEPILVKHYPSAFLQTALHDTLQARNIDTLIIAGLTTSGCVRATTMDALMHGYIPIVPAEAVGDRSKEQHGANLFDINAKLGDVVSEAEVLAWLRSVKH